MFGGILPGSCFWGVLVLGAGELPPRKLFRRCAQVPADEAAWNEFMRRYYTEVYRGICRVLGYPPCRQFDNHFDDVLQNFYQRLLANDRRALLAFRGNSEGEAINYIRRTAVNSALNFVRKRKQDRSLVPLDRPASEDGQRSAIDPAEASDEDTILEREAVNKILPEMLRGRNKNRNILLFKLAAFEGLSSQDIASIAGLEVTTRAVDNQVSRIRQRLQRELGRMRGLL